MRDLNGTVYTPPNPPEGFTEKGLAVWAVLIAAIILGLGILSEQIDLVTIGNMLLRLGLYASFVVLFNLFFYSRRNNTNENIFSTPVSTAVFCGLVAAGAAIAIAA